TPVDWTQPLDPRFQRTLGVILHDNVRSPAAGGAAVMNVYDVRVARKAAHRALLAKETLEIVRARVGSEDLHRNRPVEKGVQASKPYAESATAVRRRVLKSLRYQIRGNDRVERATGWCWISHRGGSRLGTRVLLAGQANIGRVRARDSASRMSVAQPSTTSSNASQGSVIAG